MIDNRDARIGYLIGALLLYASFVSFVVYAKMPDHPDCVSWRDNPNYPRINCK